MLLAQQPATLVIILTLYIGLVSCGYSWCRVLRGWGGHGGMTGSRGVVNHLVGMRRGTCYSWGSNAAVLGIVVATSVQSATAVET